MLERAAPMLRSEEASALAAAAPGLDSPLCMIAGRVRASDAHGRGDARLGRGGRGGEAAGARGRHRPRYRCPRRRDDGASGRRPTGTEFWAVSANARVYARILLWPLSPFMKVRVELDATGPAAPVPFHRPLSSSSSEGGLV